MTRRATIEQKLRELKPILRERFNFNRIGYFGSWARTEANESSDLDILVEFTQPLGWAFFDLRDLLEAETALTVDLVTEPALKLQIRDSILTQVVYL